ncbi:MAG: cytochrome P450 [Myxococcota bacterium]|jgi:cholest-4-en-3-one 26-monooxygenase|nr:cytochrome P450 [Myxococcota bacterium]
MPDHATREEIRLLDGHFYVDRPLENFEWMRENAPVYWDESGEIWGVSLHEDIMAVSKSPLVFCSNQSSRPERGPIIPSMINMDDPDHKQRRSLVNSGFTPRRLKESEAKIRRITNRLIDEVCERGECEFVREIAAPLPLIMIGDMLGMPEEDFETLLRWSEDMLAATSATASPELQERAQQAGVEYATYALNAIQERRQKPTDDLLSTLVHAEIEGHSLNEEALIHESLLILVGGDETTRHVITEGALALIENPGERQKLFEEPGRIPTAVEELLRWVSPIKNMNRTATRDTELRGQKLREGDRVLLLYPSGNRDEKVFPSPNSLDVERSPNPHVAFGGYGTHHCLGASLARLELRIMFEELCLRLPDLELASDAPLPRRASNFIAGIERMPVRFTPSSRRAD